jgi:phenylalanyl-tRNA synthetase beta chain
LTRDRLVRRVLTGAGISEAVTFGFVEARAAEAFVNGETVSPIVPIANPLSAKFDVLRPSLLPGLIDVVARNRRHGRRDVALFEIGARFSLTTGETRGVGVALTGSATAEHWSGGSREFDFYDAKGLVELLGDTFGIDMHLDADNSLPGLVPGQSARIVHGTETLGVVGTVQPMLLDRAGAPKQDRVVAAELNLDRMTALQAVRSEAVQPLPRHPFVVRDLSIVVPDILPAAVIRDTIQTAGRDEAAPLTAITFFDRYQGKGVPDGSISVSVRLTFQASDRTLTDADVQHAFEQILSALVREHGAVQR